MPQKQLDFRNEWFNLTGRFGGVQDKVANYTRMKTTLLLCAVPIPLTVGTLAQPSKPRPATTSQLLVQGIWAASQEANAEFWVAGSRLTYVEWPNEHMRYHITPTTLTIMQADGPYICRIKKLTRDSLVYVTPAGFVARLYKRK